MKKHSIFYLRVFAYVFITLQSMQLSAQTNVSGDQSGTWKKSLSPYIITGAVTVAEGNALIIEAGVEVQFPQADDGNPTSRLIIQGKLSAVGTKNNPVKFTGGSITQSDDWRGPVTIEATSNNSVLQYVTIDGLGYGSSYANDYRAGLIIRSASCTVQNCNIQNTHGTAVQLDNAAAQITDNIFTANTNMDIITGIDNLTGITGNNALKIGLTASTITKNNTLTTSHLYYRLLANLTVPQGKILTINPGVELQFPQADDGALTSKLTVEGKLNAVGTNNNPVKFTGGSISQSDDWRGPIVIEATSNNSILQYVTIDGLGYGSSYANDYRAGLIIRSSTCTVKNCNIQNTHGTAIQLDNAAPQIADNIFTANTNMDVISGIDNLTSLTGNNALKIGLTASTITKNNILTTNHLYYRLLANLTVPQGKILTINPGVEVQFPQADDGALTSMLIVQGKLNAAGTNSKPIKFTGGTITQSDDWRGPVVIEATSNNSILQYVTIDGLGYGSSYANDYRAGLIIRSSTCTVKNCNIQNTHGTAIQLDNAAPQISNNLFTANTNMDVISAIDNLTSLTGNNALKIGLTASTITKNNTLTTSNLYYRLLANLTVPQGKTLTINPGVEVQFPQADDGALTSMLTVQGKLNAAGTNSKPIKFTGGTITQSDDWRGPVTIEPTSNSSVLQYVTVDGLGYGSSYASFTRGILIVRSSSCTIKNCYFNNSRGSAIVLENSSPIINNNAFSGSQYADIYGSALSFPNVTNNGSAQVYVASSTVNQNTNWPLPGTISSRYILLGTVNINQGITLSIAKGVIVDFNNNNGNIFINGTLKAIGDKANKIQFLKQANDGVWGGSLSFASSSKNSELSFVYIDKLGNINSPSKGSAVEINSKSIAINNVSISNSQNTGLSINNASPVIVQSSFFNNKNGVISTAGKASFIQCSFSNNTSYGMKNLSTKAADKIDARYCWWGTAKGPKVSTNPTGTGDSITSKILYEPFQKVKSDLNSPVIDDIDLSDSLACPGSIITVSSRVTGVFEEGNVFTAQLSDASGSFANPAVIGTDTAYFVGNLVLEKITATLPDNLSGTGYRVRVVSTLPEAISASASVIPANCAGVAQFAKANVVNSSFVINAYPNPTNNTSLLQVNGLNENLSIKISNISGRIIWQKNNITDKQIKLPTDTFIKGIYLVSVSNGKETKFLKLVKE